MSIEVPDCMPNVIQVLFPFNASELRAHAKQESAERRERARGASVVGTVEGCGCTALRLSGHSMCTPLPPAPCRYRATFVVTVAVSFNLWISFRDLLLWAMLTGCVEYSIDLVLPVLICTQGSWIRPMGSWWWWLQWEENRSPFKVAEINPESLGREQGEGVMELDRQSLDEWAKDKPLSILQLDPADRAVLKIAGNFNLFVYVRQ